MKKKAEISKKAEDDGRVIASMEFINGKKAKKTVDNSVKYQYDRREKFRMVMGAYLHYIPILLLILGCFTLVFLFIKYVWLA